MFSESIAEKIGCFKFKKFQIFSLLSLWDHFVNILLDLSVRMKTMIIGEINKSDITISKRDNLFHFLISQYILIKKDLIRPALKYFARCILG
jgi:hypothetical protein